MDVSLARPKNQKGIHDAWISNFTHNMPLDLKSVDGVRRNKLFIDQMISSFRSSQDISIPQ